MIEICLRLRTISKGEMARGCALPESGDLRKHVPHPVGTLATRPNLGERLIVGVLLRLNKASEISGQRHDETVYFMPIMMIEKEPGTAEGRPGAAVLPGGGGVGGTVSAAIAKR